MEWTRGQPGLRRAVLVMAALMGAFLAVLTATTLAGAAPLTGTNVNIDRLCLSANGYTDKTAAANDGTANDVTLASSLPTDPTYVYFGMQSVFNELAINVGTPGVEGTVIWRYYDGAGWATLEGVSDGTNNLRNTGPNLVSFSPPANWAKKDLGAPCAGEYYYLRTATGTRYQVAPQGTQISAQTFNLRIKIEDELGGAIAGLPQSALRVSGGTDNTFYAFRDIGAGSYELALAANTADTNYDLEVERDGYVTSFGTHTGGLAGALTTLETPIKLAYGFKVTGITAEGATSAVSSATVSTGDGFGVLCTEAAAAWYCPVPVDQTGLLVQVVKDGYVSDASTRFATDRAIHVESQRTVAARDLRTTVKVTVAGQSSLTGVTWEKSVNGGPFATTTPAATLNNIAYFALPPSETGVILKAIKGNLAADSGPPFTPSALSQTERTVLLYGGASTTPPTSVVPTSVQPTPSEKPPTVSVAKASAPPEAGPIIPVSWTSPPIPAGGVVELWALDGKGEPRLHHRSSDATGRVAFYGIAGHTYHFFARMGSSSASAAVANLVPGAADATTRVLTDRLTVSSAALAGLGLDVQAFYTVDEDADGFPEGFTDPQKRFALSRVLGRESHLPAFVLTDGTSSRLWDLLDNRVLDVAVEEATDPNAVAAGREATLTVRRGAAEGWVLLSADDPYPGYEITSVTRSDGSQVASDRVWREGGKAYVLDDAGTEYSIAYRRPAPSLWPWIAGGAATLGSGIAIGFLLWVVGPSVEALRASPPAVDEAAWRWRHCARCHVPLPRRSRLARSRHACAPAPTPDPRPAPTLPAVPRIGAR